MIAVLTLTEAKFDQPLFAKRFQKAQYIPKIGVKTRVGLYRNGRWRHDEGNDVFVVREGAIRISPTLATHPRGTALLFCILFGTTGK